MPDDKCYYPRNKNCTEISIKFYGDRKKIFDILCYFKLKSFRKELNLSYPDFIIESEYFSYGDNLRYECRSIVDEDEEKKNKIKIICNELIRYGIKNKIIPKIEFIKYGEKIIIYTLEDYLKNEDMELSEINVEGNKFVKIL